MLVNLSIADLAVVQSLDLGLEPGMSVLTGETGAGKSILLTALGLALGDRADSAYVRPNAKRAEVNLEFDLSDAPLARQWLLDNELDDGELCLIRRTISDDGRSKAYINNTPVNLQTLQSLSRLLVEIHGQHAHLTLLDNDQQRSLLDSYARNESLLTEIAEVYKQHRSASKELHDLQQQGSDQSDREDLLRYQLNELQALDLDHFDYTSLAEQHHKLANLGKILSVGRQQLELLYDHDQQNLSDSLRRCVNELTDLAGYAAELNPVVELLSEAEIQINEASQALRRFLDHQETDPQQFEWLETQLALIQQLSRKHRTPPEQLPEIAQQIAKQLEAMTHSGERIESLKLESQQLFNRYQELAKALRKSRLQAAQDLQSGISKTIQELGLPHGQFLAEVKPLVSLEPQLQGLDQIEFLISTNPGLPAKPLSKVASGGELSRVSLAIQVTTSTDKTTPTMIFDEVDSGIGGGIAEIVGQKLRQLSGKRQVLCVTHLPQVAAQAHQHLFVAKDQQRDITASTVFNLSEQERVQELARMLGGVTITANTLAHAAEMLELGSRQ
ncbi:MAG: DNA repair protein RecN [Methylococcaceae bacterium]|nr:DNA repair protein RecN [Methylococcaceae bacterium]